MPVLRTLLVLLVVVSLVRSAEIRTLSGQVLKGDLVRVSDKEIVLRTDSGEVATPLSQVLLLDLKKPVSGPPKDGEYVDVRLLDDSLLHCSKVVLKKTDAELTLLNGQNLKLAQKKIYWILRDAQDAELRKKWNDVLALKSKRDRIVVFRNGEFNPLEGTFGDADDKGETINFRLESGKTIPAKLENLKGLVFYQEPPEAAPVCQVIDTQGDVWVASKVDFDDKGFRVTTPAGLTMTLAETTLAKLDYNMGKLTYLSDLTPAKVNERSLSGLVTHYRRDTNLDGEPIVLENRTYGKGLSAHAHTELEYELGGKYKEFRAVVGIDPRVGGDSQPRVTVEVDGSQVFSEVINAKAARPLALNVRNASRLRIIVSSQNPLDLHDHVTIAEARVSQ
jgi:hypothetical protein